MSKNIIIAGDSWGCGEWPRKQGFEIEHKGLEQYFIEYGYTVVNLSKGGSSNSESIKRLIQHGINVNDIVFWIMSGPFRDLMPDVKKITKALVDAQGVYSLLRNLMQKSFNELNQIGHPINLIGGLCNIDTDISSSYNNLTALIPSWVNLLVGNMPEYTHSKNQNFVMIPGIFINYVNLSEIEQDLAKSIIDDLYTIDKNMLVFREDVFRPDGCHPNRHGHKILFDSIVNALEIDRHHK
jgi:hypothetical protein